MKKLNEKQFLSDFNINEERYNEAEIKWENLVEIYEDYENYKNTLKSTGDVISQYFRSIPEVHSVRSRIKDSYHLLDKIVRKIIRQKKGNPSYSITIQNYRSEITDLIGVRIIHLYKNTAAEIDSYIRTTWDQHETPTIYYRAGDFTQKQLDQLTNEFMYKEHMFGYRSWHYLIETRTTLELHLVEVQVRTLFEEGWSEIDHQLRYPNNTDNKLLTEQLLVLNRLAGSADELVNSIKESKANFENMELINDEKTRIIDELKEEIAAFSNIENDETQNSLNDKIEELQNLNNIKLISLKESLNAQIQNNFNQSLINIKKRLIDGDYYNISNKIVNNPGLKLQKQIEDFHNQNKIKYFLDGTLYNSDNDNDNDNNDNNDNNEESDSNNN
ncbi:nucleotidyltransferase family protein [Planomicrobium okeanokoites]|uniref:RelA/SpoT domain-containing protein n=1 Tax=Planomicrobium okeanokoites TaxID=244 RepID=A0ABV7KL84_PLAOK|nr:hypothetical protein [Planomicrobium okeanokoites]TAA69380.1 hypothetical protein D2910_08555 [Planomicrobium okeanokoites]